LEGDRGLRRNRNRLNWGQRELEWNADSAADHLVASARGEEPPLLHRGDRGPIELVAAALRDDGFRGVPIDTNGDEERDGGFSPGRDCVRRIERVNALNHLRRLY
jgi:hypothetical protein